MTNSSLKQHLASRHVSQPHQITSVLIGQPTSGLMIECWEGESWVLPWSCLLFARLSSTDADAELILTFSAQRISARGRNLKPALDAVVGFRLNVMRELPAIYQSQNWTDAPLVKKISVDSSEK